MGNLMNACGITRVGTRAGAVVAFALGLGFSALSSEAGPIIDSPETWTSSGAQGWTNTAPDVSLSNPGGAPGYLLITFPAVGNPPDPGETLHDTIYTFTSPATNIFGGNLSNVLGARFVLSNSVVPSAISVVFGVATNDNEWTFILDPAAAGQWTPYNVVFQFSLWTMPGGTESEFLADLLAVEYIGIHIDRGGSDQEYYGLDDFTLYVPEPADYLLLAAGLFGFALVFRRRLRTWKGWSSGLPA
ncbi:MAG: PEP-CTERM sorting domain-containing protein [bacterium]